MFIGVRNRYIEKESEMATPIEQFESFLTKGGIDYVRFDRWREGEEGQFVTFRSKYG